MKSRVLLLTLMLNCAAVAQAQRVGIGTAAPVASLEVTGHGKTGTLSYTDSAMGPAFSLANYSAAPAGMRGEYRGAGLNHGSGVLGAAMSTAPGYGNGVTGKGGYTGVMGLGMPGGYAAVYAAADSATYGLYVEGNTSFNGNITGTGTNTYTSDRKLKKDIRPLSNAMDIIGRLQPSSYQYRVGEFGSMYLPEGRHYGVIAQDLQQVLPELVINQHYNPMDKKEKDFDYLSVNYSELIPILIKAMQEQQQINEVLKKKIAVLEKKTGMR